MKAKTQFHTQSEVVFGHKLSTRTFNALVNYGNITTKDQLLKAYLEGSLFKIRNLGAVGYNEIFDWLDKEIQSNVKPSRFNDARPKKATSPTPKTMAERTYKAMFRLARQVSGLRSEIYHMARSFENWTQANYALHRILTVEGIERKYTPTNLQ